MQAVTITQITTAELVSIVKGALREEITSVLKKSKDTLSDRWMDLDELCEYHPDKPAKQTIYGKVSRNQFPHYKDGKKLRFLKSEVDAYLARGKRNTIEEEATAVNKFLSTIKGKA